MKYIRKLMNSLSMGAIGRFTVAEVLSFVLSLTLVLCWVLTGHWLLMDGIFFSFHSVTTTFVDISVCSAIQFCYQLNIQENG